MKAAKPKLLSGGNPQIAKGYGDAPVKAYIAAVPGWQKDIAKRIDALVVKAVPGVKKAVKWNSPFYGVEEGRWFLCFHIFSRYVKVTFFDGADLKPPPEGKSKYPQVRYYDVHEGAFDERAIQRLGQASQQVAGREDLNVMATAKPKAAKRAPAPKAGASDWRRQTLARVRAVIEEAAPKAVEDTKWKKPSNPAGIPTWSQDGIICTGETYRDKIKLTFAKGAALADPAGLFNASLDGGTRRAIDIREGDKLNEKALKALIKAAVALNTSKPAKAKKAKRA